MDSNRGLSACQPNAIPLGQTGSLKQAFNKSAELCEDVAGTFPSGFPQCELNQDSTTERTVHTLQAVSFVEPVHY